MGKTLSEFYYLWFWNNIVNLYVADFDMVFEFYKLWILDLFLCNKCFKFSRVYGK